MRTIRKKDITVLKEELEKVFYKAYYDKNLDEYKKNNPVD